MRDMASAALAASVGASLQWVSISFKNPPVGGVVVDHEHGQILQIVVADPDAFLSGRFLDAQLGREVEDAALVRLRFRPRSGRSSGSRAGNEMARPRPVPP